MYIAWQLGVATIQEIGKKCGLPYSAIRQWVKVVKKNCSTKIRNQRPPADLGVWGWPLEGAGAISAGGR
jgi:hypothetical protein